MKQKLSRRQLPHKIYAADRRAWRAFLTKLAVSSTTTSEDHPISCYFCARDQDEENVPAFPSGAKLYRHIVINHQNEDKSVLAQAKRAFLSQYLSALQTSVNRIITDINGLVLNHRLLPMNCPFCMLEQIVTGQLMNGSPEHSNVAALVAHLEDEHCEMWPAETERIRKAMGDLIMSDPHPESKFFFCKKCWLENGRINLYSSLQSLRQHARTSH